jgi:F-type H+-transporting ATPase subunit alpha
MKQKQYSPLSVAEMAVSLFAVNEGHIDDVPADKVVAFETALHAHAHANHAALLDKINSTGAYDDETVAGLTQLVESFKSTGTY